VALFGVDGAGLLAATIGVAAGVFPLACLAALPAAIARVERATALRTYESPRQFLPAVRAVVGCYLSPSRCSAWVWTHA
jgi:hypothetical protein